MWTLCHFPPYNTHSNNKHPVLKTKANGISCVCFLRQRLWWFCGHFQGLSHSWLTKKQQPQRSNKRLLQTAWSSLLIWIHSALQCDSAFTVTWGIEVCTFQTELMWVYSNRMGFFFLFRRFRADCSIFLFFRSLLHVTDDKFSGTCFLLCYLRFTENNNSCHPLEQGHFSTAASHLQTMNVLDWVRLERYSHAMVQFVQL